MKRAVRNRTRSLARRIALIVPLALAMQVYAQGTAGGIGATPGAGGITGAAPGSAGMPPAAGAMPGNPTIQPGSPGPTVPPVGTPGAMTGPLNTAPGISPAVPSTSRPPTVPGTLGGVGAGCNCPSTATAGLPPGTSADPRGGVAGGSCAC
jgi:hypothetical protein